MPIQINLKASSFLAFTDANLAKLCKYFHIQTPNFPAKFGTIQITQQNVIKLNSFASSYYNSSKGQTL